MIDTIYLLCAITSILCAVLLWRGWRRSKARLLFWSTLCFAGLALNNILLVIDTRVVPEIDLALVRVTPTILGIAALVFGQVWDSE